MGDAATTSMPQSTKIPAVGDTGVSNYSPGPVSVVAARLIDQLIAAWKSGREALAEEILTDDPAAAENRDIVFQLIYEEICLRKQAGQPSASVRVLNRFPQWRSELQLLVECHHLLEPDRPPPVFPEVGERLGDFQLRAELGRGARGRVFLASQAALADRCVVFKVTPLEGGECLSLARLQHAHIVPLYFVQDFPEQRLQGLCMPYLGGLSLAALLEALSGSPPATRTGQHILNVLDRACSTAVVHLPAEGPVQRFLTKVSYSQAICWVGCCLADALHYAHERGLVHLDVKPGNILLAADGQPMLLDFHLARAPLSPREPPEWIGGTPGYMAPEHEQALLATREGRPVLAVVDGRADVYSLGLVLYEALGGPVSLPTHLSPERLLRQNSQVSVGLADIIGKCLTSDPDRRYPSAAALAADLRRHLADLPLQGAPNRSLRERWQKWRRRRRPQVVKLSTLALALLVGVTATGAWSGLAEVRQRYKEANADLTEGQQQLRQHHHAEAARTFTRALARLEHLPGRGELAETLTGQHRLALRGLAADQLHRLTDRLRFLYGNETVPRTDLAQLEEPCRTVWDSQDLLTDQGPGAFDTAFERQIRFDLLDLAVLWADLRVRLAPAEQVKEAQRDGLRLLQQAAALFGSMPMLEYERAAYAQSLEQGEDHLRASPPQPRTPWEHYALGRSLLRRGDLNRAAVEFEQAIAQQPGEFWSNFYQGLCCYRLQRYGDALAAFTVCVALAPDSSECYYNRALVRTGLGEIEAAVRDYDQALQREPRFAQAAFNRGLLHLQTQHYQEARDDLRRALDGSLEPALIHYHLALVAIAENDLDTARASLKQALRYDPAHRQAQDLFKHLQKSSAVVPRANPTKVKQPVKTRRIMRMP